MGFQCQPRRPNYSPEDTKTAHGFWNPKKTVYAPASPIFSKIKMDFRHTAAKELLYVPN